MACAQLARRTRCARRSFPSADVFAPLFSRAGILCNPGPVAEPREFPGPAAPASGRRSAGDLLPPLSQLTSDMSTALTKPIWTATSVPQAEAARLTWNVQADVCVVGAGIAGLSVALCLLEHGRSVIVLDRYDVGEGETLRTSAHLSSALDDRYVELERLHGEGGARMSRKPPGRNRPDRGLGREVRYRVRLPARGRLSLPRPGIGRTHSR